MTDHEPQPEELRAAEYVLGTLPEGDRAEVDAELARGDRDTLAEVGYWEQRLGRLGLALTPVEPPSRVWAGIALATGIGKRGGGAGIWRGVAIAATLTAVVLAGLLAITEPREPAAPPEPAYASVIRDEPTGAGWLITAAADGGVVEVTSLQPYQKPEDKSLELWLLPPDGKPMSVGLMPQRGHERLQAPQKVFEKLSAEAKFAVSLEPRGGSPKSKPTGKVLWSVPVTGAGA